MVIYCSSSQPVNRIRLLRPDLGGLLLPLLRQNYPVEPLDGKRAEFEVGVKLIAVERFGYSVGDAILERNRNGRYAVEWVRGRVSTWPCKHSRAHITWDFKLEEYRLLTPIALLMLLASILGFFIFVIDPTLQQMTPLSSWPLIARFIHDGIPAELVIVLAIVVALFAVNVFIQD